MAIDVPNDQEIPKNHAISFAEALAEEMVEIEALRGKRGFNGPLTIVHDEKRKRVAEIAAGAGASGREDKGGKAAAEEAKLVVGHARTMNLAGLAFSGGGIRSATFNLGVLQGLAQFNKLRIFDYLSTVSGGGYIGNWLEAWILRAGQEQKTVKGIDIVEEELRPTRTERGDSVAQREWKDQKSHTEPPPIRFLRDYSNYLTPRLGALGADTWTVIAIYLRNLLLNQAILVLFLFAMLLLPYIAVWLTKAVCTTWIWPQPAVAFLLLAWAISVGARNLQWLTGCKERPERSKAWLPPQDQFWVIWSIVVPFFVALWTLTAWLWGYAGIWDNCLPLYAWPLGGMVLLGVPLLIGSLIVADQQEEPTPGRIKFWWILESLVTGAVSGLLMWLVVHEAFAPMKLWYGREWHELSLGVPLTLVVFLLAATLQVGLMGRSFCDPYREWWARVAGWILILTIVWSAGFALTAYAPLGLMWLRGWLKAAGLAWIGTTLIGVLGGKSDSTGDLGSSGIKSKLLSLTPYVFIIGLFSMLSLSLELLLARIHWAQASVQTAWNAFLAESPTVEKAVGWVLKGSSNLVSGTLTLTGTTSTVPTPAAATVPPYVQAHFTLLCTATTWRLIPLCAAVLLICLLLSYCVDLNEFSMNLMYRNRLVRCYLGATHDKRDANPFSGLDCRDDFLLSTVRASEDYSGPLPILNGTLNLVNSRDLAWQERKAESFPMTPLRCGFDTWIEQSNLERNFAREREHASIAKYAYRPTGSYGYADGGFYVGTAMSISGAAASPNMGYHSTPSLALLMTFFNVRLGFWAGNPRNNDTWTRPGPKVGLGQLLSELFGLTSDNSEYIYLSDGGHFENLGIYELVKRRCKYIVACDASADPDYSFEDLGNAIRKCREDVGVEIEVDTAPLIPKKSKSGKKQTAQHCVVGTIHYNMADPDGEKGVFVYIKASLTGDEPADVLNYQTCHSTFPHESTADQWFSESQFESYRRLGQHVVESLFAGHQATVHYQDLSSPAALKAFRNLTIEKLFEELKAKWPVKPANQNPKPGN